MSISSPDAAVAGDQLDYAVVERPSSPSSSLGRANRVATYASESMSTEAPENTDDMDWRQEIVAEQSRGVPKERGRTYYYADGLFDRKQMWLKHNPGCNISMRVTKVWQPGIFGDDYDSSLQMNIGTEMDAYRLYRALEAYFNDVRTPPWFLQDVEVND